MDSMKYKDFNRVPPKPRPRPKTYEYCPEEPEPLPPPERFCKVVLKKHPSAHTLKYKMLRVCPRVDYREIQCQPIVICDDVNDCRAKPKIRKKAVIDNDDSWVLPIPKPSRCPDPIVNPCANDITDMMKLPPCKPKIMDYHCPGVFDDDDDI